MTVKLTSACPVDTSGTVVAENPAGGTSIPAGSGTSITVCKATPPQVVVPDVTGQTQSQATTTLQGLGLTDRVDLNGLLDRVDLNQIVQQVDLNEVIAKVDLDAVLDQIDMNAIAQRIDVEALVEHTDVGAVIARSSSGIASDMVDAVLQPAPAQSGFR